MASYIAIVHKDTGSDYGVSFPDFPGCISAGSTLEEARIMGQEALETCIDFMLEDGHDLPEPMSMEEAMKTAVKEGFFALLVISPEGERAKVERVNISVPSRELARIDRYAAAHGLSRSTFLVQAARRMIHRGA